MKRSETTGPVVPAWIRERVLRFEDAWPLLALSGATACAIAAMLISGVMLWTSEAAVYYAFP